MRCRIGRIYSVHVRTRKFRNLAKTKRYIVPAPGPTQKRKAEQEATRIQSATAITLFFRVFKRSEYTLIEVARVLSNTLSVTEKAYAKYQPGYRRAARFEGAEERI